jgi:hypothetical protein
LIVEVHLKLPAILDERSKELLREFGRINGGLVDDRGREAGTPGAAPIVVGSVDQETDRVTGETPRA